MVFGKSGHGPHLSSGRRRGCLPRLGRASGERRHRVSRETKPAGALHTFPSFADTNHVFQETTGGIENESNWDRAAHRRLSYNRISQKGLKTQVFR